MMPFKKSAFAGHPNLQMNTFAWRTGHSDLEPVIVVPSAGDVPGSYPYSAPAYLCETEAGVLALAAQIKKSGVANEWANGTITWYLNALHAIAPVPGYETDKYLRALVRQDLPSPA